MIVSGELNCAGFLMITAIEVKNRIPLAGTGPPLLPCVVYISSSTKVSFGCH